MENYTYSETTPEGEFKNGEANEIKPPIRFIWTASNLDEYKM